MADGSVTIEVTLTKDQLEKGLKGLKSDINNALPSASKTLSTFANGFESIGKLATSAGKKITVATAGIVAGLSSAVSRFDTLNNYPKVLSNLGFSAEEAQDSINELSKGIDGLPTSLDDAASGVQRLVAKNSNIKKSTKYFLAMNDAIVAGNAPAEQQASAIEQLTQAYSKGKPDLMEWRTLMMAMPGQLKQVATAMGYVDTDELYEALNKGKISMDTFMDAIVELDQNGGKGIVSFQEQAKNSCDSIGTAITNTANRFKKGFATILTSMNDAAKNTSFGSLAGMINSFSTSIKNFLDKIGETIKKNKTFQVTINQISNVLTVLDNKIKNLTPEQLDKIVTTIINLAKAGPVLLAVGKGFNILGSSFKGLSSVASVVEKIGGSFGQLSSKLMSLSGMSTKTIGSILKIGGVFSKVFGIAGIVGLVTVGLGLLQSKFGEQINSILSMVTEKGPQIVSNFINGIVSKIPDLIAKGGELLQNFLNALITNLPDIIKGGMQIISSLVIGIAKQLPTLIPMALETIITIVMSLLDNIDLIIDAGIELILGLADGLIEALPKLIEKIPVIIDKLLIAITNNLPKLIAAGIQLVVKLAYGLIQAIPSLLSAGWDLMMAFINYLGRLPQMMWDIGKNVVLGIWQGVQSYASWLWQQVRNFASNIVNSIKSALGIHSPSRVFKDQVGKNIALGIGEGFDDNINKVYSQMKSAVDFETQKLSTNLSATANVNRNMNVNLNQSKSDVYLDGRKVGQSVTPYVSQTVRVGGI